MMAWMRSPLILAAFLAAGLTGGAQDKKEEGAVDVLFLHDRSEVRGEILEFGTSGRFKVKVPTLAKPVEYGIEEIARMRFSADSARPTPPAGEQARLAGGGTITGKLASFDGETAVLESSWGPVRIRRRDLKALILGSP